MPIKTLKTLASRHIHPKVRIDTCELPDGRIIEPVILEFSDWACVFALTKQQEVLLIRLYRHGVGKIIWEIPGGVIDPGETPLEAIRRELLEETGYTAKHWRHVVTLHAGIGYSNEAIELYVARDLTHVGHQRDEGEFMEVFTMSLADAVEKVGTGEITDTKTAFSLLWLDKFRDRLEMDQQG